MKAEPVEDEISQVIDRDDPIERAKREATSAMRWAIFGVVMGVFALGCHIASYILRH